MNHKCSVAVLSAWLLLATAPAHSGFSQTTSDAAPQAFGTLSGKVSDTSTGSSLHGASVRVEGTAYETYTDERGEFRLPRIPAGTQRINISYLSYSPETATVSVREGMEVEHNITLDSEIVQMGAYQVTSIAEGEARAINRQRASDTFVTIVSSDAAGNLPDLSIQDVLSRLAGISISEGGGVTIRGASPDLNSITLDGERMSYATDSGEGETRAVSVANIETDLIASVEVIRALPPSMDADGIGGTVNLRTRSAFDLRQRIFSGRFDYTVNSIGGDDYGSTLTYGDVVGDRWGYIFSLSYQRTRAGSERGEVAYNFDAFEFPVIRSMDVRQNTLDRERHGLSATIDHKLSDTTELSFKAFFNREEGESTQYRYFSGNMRLWNPATASSTFAEGRAAPERRMTDSNNKKEYYRLGVRGRTELENFRLDYEVNYDRSESEFDQISLFGRIPNSNPNVPGRDDRVSFSYDRTDPLWPQLTLVNPNFPDVDPRFIYDAQIVNRVQFNVTPPGANFEDAYNGRFDVRTPREIAGLPLYLQGGFKFRGKFKKSAPRSTRYDLSSASKWGYIKMVSDFLEGGYEPTDVAQGRYDSIGGFPNPDLVREEYLRILGTQTPEESVHPTGSGQVRARLEANTRNMVRRTFTTSEDIYSSYGQGTLDVGKLRLIGGVRVEQTRTESKGRRYNQALTVIEPLEANGKYTDFFPSLIAAYRWNDNHVFRAGWTNTIARPNYQYLVPFESVPDDESRTNELVDIGNPDLKAQSSRNLDLSYEWYFQPVGLLTVAVFQKDIKDFIYQSIRHELRTVDVSELDQPPVYEQVLARLRSRLNGADARLRGMELSWQHQLTFLPSPFDGLGLNANYTYTKGESQIPDDLTGELLKFDYLFRQAKNVYNFQLYYEKYGFSARVAMRYNGGYHENVTDTGTVLVNPTTYLDASVQYNITRNFTLFLEGKNLSKEILSWYFNSAATPTEWRIRDYGYRGGVKFRF